MRKLHLIVTLVASAVALSPGTPAARAQQQSGAPPEPALKEYSALWSTGNAADQEGLAPIELKPDTRPLSGVENLTLGVPLEARSALLTGLDFTQVAATNGLDAATTGRLATVSYLLGQMGLQRVSARSQLNLFYFGGGSISNGSDSLNNSLQEFSATQGVKFRRWELLFVDQFSYLPESTFGLSGVPDLGEWSTVGGALTSNFPVLQATLNPSQSIITGGGIRLSNSVVAQAEYDVSPRSSLTFGGSYGLLHFLDRGFTDNSNLMVMAGYNRLLNRKDSLAILYRYNAFRFSNTSQAIDDHVAQLAYGRRITGRLALQLAAGPDVRLFRLPASPTQTRVTWNAGSSITYQLNVTQFSLSYDHLVTGGSGVFTGADTHQVQTGISRQLSRLWQGSLLLGYARNRPLSPVSSASGQQTFNSWSAGGTLSHPLARSFRLFFGYTAQVQDSAAPFCTGVICGTSLARHVISIGFTGRSRPIPID